MDNSIQSQAYIFFATLYGGIIIGFIYDIYRIFRYYSKPKKVATFIEDLIFWLIVSVISLFILIFSNWGEIRGYVFLGFISGAFLYSRLLSKPVITVLVYVVNFIVKVVKCIFRILFFPFKLIAKQLYVPYMKVVSRADKTRRKVKKLFKLPFLVANDMKKHAKTIIKKK